MKNRVMMNRAVFSIGFSLATMLCQSEPALAQQAGRGEAIITLDGNSYALKVFECRHDYLSPIEPDRTIAFALSAVPEGTPEDLLEQLRESGDGGDSWRRSTPCLLAEPFSALPIMWMERMC